MNETLILTGMMLAAWAGLIYLRVPSSIAFLSLLIGQLLSAQASENVYSFISSVFQIKDIDYIKATLLMLPLLLTMAFLRNHLAKSKMIIEAGPLLFIVALALLLLAPLIQPLETLINIATDDQVEAYKSLIVVAASVSGLLSAWLSYPKAGGKDGHKHGHGKH